VVAINAFPGDFESEHEAIRQVAAEAGVRVAVARHVVKGGPGARELAELVVEAAHEPTSFRPLYELDQPLVDKIDVIAREVCGADGVDMPPLVAKQLARFEELGYGGLPVVIAKTHLSISSDPTLRGAPKGWRLPVREVRAAVGAGYVYAICGEMRTMPGLPKHPGAERIDIDDDGNVVGLA
jgi:formate--tetrahydrofolate ligase